VKPQNSEYEISNVEVNAPVSFMNIVLMGISSRKWRQKIKWFWSVMALRHSIFCGSIFNISNQ